MYIFHLMLPSLRFISCFFMIEVCRLQERYWTNEFEWSKWSYPIESVNTHDLLDRYEISLPKMTKDPGFATIIVNSNFYWLWHTENHTDWTTCTIVYVYVIQTDNRTNAAYQNKNFIVRHRISLLHTNCSKFD